MSRYLKIKKWLWCRWFHNKDLCYPEVWNRGLDGPFHCAKCYPCGQELVDLLVEFLAKEENMT